MVTEARYKYYYYLFNAQNDVIGLIDRAGNKVVSYAYNSWGVPLTTVDNSKMDIAGLNPFRYRCYCYDEETAFYYLKSRYYDPQVGRFINADNLLSTGGKSVQGHNLYVYCFDNPVNMDDEAGNWPRGVQKVGNAVKRIVTHARNKVKTVIKQVKQDIRNFDMKNENEQKVLESNYFSAYKGKLVLRTNLSRSGSFGILFIRRSTQENDVSPDEVRHEYGHTKQLDQLGIMKYTFCIGIPSLFKWGTGEYYSKPWEVTADIYGEVQSRPHSEETVAAGYEYLEKSKVFGPLVWSTIDW